MCLCEDGGAASSHSYAASQQSAGFHSEVLVYVLRQIGHALHLCLLLWPQRFLPQTEEEENGVGGGRGG